MQLVGVVEFLDAVINLLPFRIGSQIGHAQTRFVGVGDFLVELNEGIIGGRQSLVQILPGRKHV